MALERLASDPEGLLELRILSGGTLEDVHRHLADEQFDVLHYIGHGIDRASDDEALLLGTDSRPYPVSFSTFAAALRPHSGLRLVFLNGCGTDTSAAAAADELPASVLGMRGFISPWTRGMFATELYGSVLHGIPLEAAASSARRQVNYAKPGSREWGAPVLYLGTAEVLLAPQQQIPAVPIRRPLDVAGNVAGEVVAVDPERQRELEYLNKKLDVTQANLDALRKQWEPLGDALPELVATQISELEEQHSQTSRRISELER